MTDYTKTSGENGTMMIRDTGTTVEFLFKAGDPSDWVNGLEFSWTANGTTKSRTINYPTGADWYKLGSVTVTETQTVTFRLLTDTSIAGIGGPTTFSHKITRSTVPEPPSRPSLTKVTATSVTVSFTANGNGGATITGYQIGYGTSSTSASTIISATSPTTINGLTSGTTYYFWVRARNSVGYSSWSPSAHVRTIAGAYIKVSGVWKLAVPYVRVGGVWKLAEPWARSLGVWKRTG
jgi:hypothetical protein